MNFALHKTDSSARARYHFVLRRAVGKSDYLSGDLVRQVGDLRVERASVRRLCVRLVRLVLVVPVSGQPMLT